MSSIGFGIIGCGNIAGVHAKSIVEIDGAKLLGIANVPGFPSPTEMAAAYGATPYADYNEMLQADDIDVVCLCVPSGARWMIHGRCREPSDAT